MWGTPTVAANQRSRHGKRYLGEERLRLPPKACGPTAREERDLVEATFRGVVRVSSRGGSRGVAAIGEPGWELTRGVSRWHVGHAGEAVSGSVSRVCGPDLIGKKISYFCFNPFPNAQKRIKLRKNG
jgi:hypothetical protein